jgi:pimeloyl-ACP methyl ester carboxylesterase
LRFESEPLQLHAESMRAPSWHGYLYQLLATAGWTSWPWLKQVQAPALVMMGKDDPIVPPVNGRIIAAGLRKSTLETVDCGHLFVLTRAAQTARRVEQFMDQHAARP